MMTQDTVGTILQTIFQLPTGFIVPKQGNWWNPQDITNSGTWIAYLFRPGKPIAYPSIQDNGDGTYQEFVPMMGTLELQFVGPDSEALAQSCALWMVRPDIHALFDANYGQLAYEDFGAIEVSNFTQQGLNGVLAYNVRGKIQWANMIQVSSTLITVVDVISGNVTVN